MVFCLSYLGWIFQTSTPFYIHTLPLHHEMDAISVNDYGLQVISPKFKYSISVIFLAPMNHSKVLWADQNHAGKFNTSLLLNAELALVISWPPCLCFSSPNTRTWCPSVTHNTSLSAIAQQKPWLRSRIDDSKLVFHIGSLFKALYSDDVHKW